MSVSCDSGESALTTFGMSTDFVLFNTVTTVWRLRFCDKHELKVDCEHTEAHLGLLDVRTIRCIFESRCQGAGNVTPDRISDCTIARLRSPTYLDKKPRTAALFAFAASRIVAGSRGSAS